MDDEPCRVIIETDAEDEMPFFSCVGFEIPFKSSHADVSFMHENRSLELRDGSVLQVWHWTLPTYTVCVQFMIHKPNEKNQGGPRMSPQHPKIWRLRGSKRSAWGARTTGGKSRHFNSKWKILPVSGAAIHRVQ